MVYDRNSSIKKNNFIFIVFFVIILGFLIYRPSFRAPFQFDDDLVITYNPTITNLKNIFLIWHFDPSRFLTHLSFAVNYHYGKFSPEGYHGVNWGIHIGVTLILYFFIYFTLRQHYGQDEHKNKSIFLFSFLSTLFFLVHSIQTSAVTYVAQRSTLLTTFFYLASLVSYISYRRNNQVFYYRLALFMAFLGVFCKPIIVTLPLAVFLYEVHFFKGQGRKWKDIILDIIPFVLVVSIVPVLLVLWKYKSFDPEKILNMTRETITITRMEYLFTQFRVLITYLRLLFFPVNQNLDYDYPISKSFFNIDVLVSFSILILLIFLAMRFYKNGKRLHSFAIFWIFITLSLESSIFPIADVIFEHRLYLPMVGFVLLLPEILRFCVGEKKVLTVSAIIIVCFSFLTYQRNIVWADKVGFLEDVVRKSPNKSRPHNNLGAEYWRKGEYALAMSEYQKAITLEPDDSVAYFNRGNIYLSRGDLDLALKDFNKGLSIDPSDALLYNSRGTVYSDKGEYDLALKDFQKAFKFWPGYMKVFNSRGLMFLKQKKYSLAYADFTKVIIFQPNNKNVYLNRANLYYQIGRYEESISDLNKAIIIDKNFSKAYYLRSIVYHDQGAWKISFEDILKAKKFGANVDNKYFLGLKSKVNQ